LGLSISRQILEKHGAFIEVDSVLGQGTTFRLSFPLPSQKAPLMQEQTSAGETVA
jgi:signal transduction histidine kinase